PDVVVAFFFFFQAEDGIRDRNVTGVQTCALPILTGFGSVEALVFDMFGTVVDWRTNVAAEVASLLGEYVPSLDAYEFADAWRAEYQPSMERVRKGDRPFVRLDVLHRENLDTVLEQFGTD